MSEQTTEPVVAPASGVSRSVSDQVDSHLKLLGMVDKYTAKYKTDEDYDQKRASFVLMVKGIAAELTEKGRKFGDGEEITFDWIFEQANKYWSMAEKEPVPTPDPPKPARVPATLEVAETTVSGHESFTPENFPLHDDQKWLAVARENRRRIKTLKTTADSKSRVNSILESLV